MSSLESRVIVASWVGVDEISPVMSRISGGLTNMGRTSQAQTQMMGRSFGYLGQQARILRRSFEYAVAGFGIYKVIQAFQAYKQFRSELGSLNTNLQVGTSVLNQYGRAAIDISNRTAVPVDQVVQSFQNLAASFPDISQKAKQYLFPIMAEIEAKASNIFGQNVAPQQFGATILQAARSFYGAQRVTTSIARNPRGNNLLQKTAEQIIQTYQQVPGTTGEALISSLPMLFQGAKVGGLTIPQALALFTISQRVSGRPAQTAQYLRQLFIRLKAPTPAAREFLQASVGLGPTQLASEGGLQILKTILAKAATLPGGVSEADIRRMASTGNFQGIHLTGQAATFLQQALGGQKGAGRIQSLIALTSLSTGYADIDREVSKLTNHLIDINKENNKFLDENRMTLAATNFQNMTTTMFNSLSPVIDLLSRGVTYTSQLAIGGVRGVQRAYGFVNKHTGISALNRATGGIGGTLLDTSVTVGALYALRRAGLFRGMGSLLNRTPLGRLGRLFGRQGEAGLAESVAGRAIGAPLRGSLDVQALASALTGAANGTPSSPFWVVIHPLSASTVPGMFRPGSNIGPADKFLSKKGLENMAESETKKVMPYITGPATVAAYAARKSLMSRIAARTAAAAIGRGAAGVGEAAGLRLGLRALGPAGIAAGFLIDPGNLYDPNKQGRGTFGFGDYTLRPRGTFLQQYLSRVKGQIPAGLTSTFTRFATGRISEQRVDRAISNYYTKNLSVLGTKQMSEKQASAFYKYLSPIYNLGNRRTFMSRAMASTQDSTELTLTLEPTAEFKNMIKPMKVRVKIPTRMIPGEGSPAPTSRGKTTARRVK